MESALKQLTKGFNDVRVEEEEDEDEEEDDSQKQKVIIPQDLLRDEILSRLPLKCVVRFKSVSKHWYSTLSSHSFANTHFKLSPFSQPSSPTRFLFIQSGPHSYIYSHHDDDDVDDPHIRNYFDAQKGLLKLNSNLDVSFTLVGSSNGLVCFASSSPYFLIWNPLTLQFRTIVDSFLHDSSNSPTLSWGFGYASSLDDYKVVRIIELHHTLEIVIHVFSLRSNEWTRIGAPVYDHVLALTTTDGEDDDDCSLLFETNVGVLVNHTLHWIVYTDEGWGRKIVTFDLNLEVFHDFPHLQLRSTEAFRDDFLCVLGGCLSTWGVNIREDVSIDMLKTPGVKESMTLYRDLNLGSCKDAVGFTRTGKFFVIDRYDTQLGLVDPRSSPKMYTRLVSFQSSCDNQIANYVPSLISPFPMGNLLAQ